MKSTHLTLLALALACFVSAPGAETLVVGPGGFAEIQAAVDAAQPGDTILVKTGGYQPFTVKDKGLVITADTGAFVSVPELTVRDVPAGQSVRIRGLETFSLNNGPGLTVDDCVGPVWIEDCVLSGALQSSASIWSQGADVSNSAAVSFHRCTLGGSFSIYTHGGHGLFASNSLVALFDCTLDGGQGGNQMDSGATLLAGAGASIDGGSLYASGTALRGGNGGSGSGSWGCVDAGDGGPGLLLDGGATAQLLGSQTTGGAGGVSPSTCADGLQGPGQSIPSGSVLEQPFPARSLGAPNPVRAGDTLTLTIEGVAGDLALLWFSPKQAPLYVPPVNDPLLPIAGGLFLPDVSTSFRLTAGTLGPSGLQLQFPIQTAGSATLELYAQALLVSGAASGGIVFSSGQGIAILAAGL